MPEELAKKYPDSIRILGPYAFHYPLFDDAGLRAMFEETHEYPEAYLHHLWESFSWEKYLKGLQQIDIFEKESTFNLIARKYV